MNGKKTKLFLIAAVILVCLCGVFILMRQPKTQQADYQAIASQARSASFFAAYPQAAYYAGYFPHFQTKNIFIASGDIPEIFTFKPRRADDYQVIASQQEYNAVFLSMYPTDTYHEVDLAYFRAMNIFMASYCIPDISTFKQYMRHIAESDNPVTTVYLGIRPDKMNLYRLQSLIDLYPGVTFEVIIACPSITYWQQLSPRNYDRTLSAYNKFLTAAPTVGNANFYFMGTQEWLVSNPANYISEWHTTEDASSIIMLNSDTFHKYVITAENAASIAEDLTALTADYRANPKTYPDLSDHCLVFWGDSIIGNYTDSSSIPGVVSGLTDAVVYNCGYGGSSAAMDPADPEQLISLPGIVDAFFAKDLSLLPEEIKDVPVYTGLAAYLENPPADKTMCYIINYGLNDYFLGHPISSEDPYDIATYSGALRTAVTAIRANDPNAQIILCTPTFTALYENGTEPHGANNHILTDYVQAVLDLSAELQVDALDNYYGLDMNEDNFTEYLYDDLVHPNYTCRYILGVRLTSLIR